MFTHRSMIEKAFGDFDKSSFKSICIGLGFEYSSRSVLKKDGNFIEVLTRGFMGHSFIIDDKIYYLWPYNTSGYNIRKMQQFGSILKKVLDSAGIDYYHFYMPRDTSRDIHCNGRHCLRKRSRPKDDGTGD